MDIATALPNYRVLGGGGGTFVTQDLDIMLTGAKLLA
jgi:hypothetical protein